MKTKSLKVVLVLFLALCLGLLAGCGSVSQKYADKVNEAAEKEEYLTYEQVLKDLGDPDSSTVIALTKGSETGACSWYKNCKNAEEAQEKSDKNELKYIVVTFVNGKATSATYVDQTKKSEK